MVNFLLNATTTGAATETSNASLFETLSIIAFVAAAAFLIVAVFLFIYYKIPSVISDLSGRNARKSIAKTRAKNESLGSKGHAPNTTNIQRGLVTETVQPTTPVISAAPAKPSKPAKAKKQSTATVNLDQPVPVQNSSASTPETTLFAENNAMGNFFDSEETGMLSSDGDTVLLATPEPRSAGKTLTMLDSVVLIHTDEVI